MRVQGRLSPLLLGAGWLRVTPPTYNLTQVGIWGIYKADETSSGRRTFINHAASNSCSKASAIATHHVRGNGAVRMFLGHMPPLCNRD